MASRFRTLEFLVLALLSICVKGQNNVSAISDSGNQCGDLVIAALNAGTPLDLRDKLGNPTTNVSLAWGL
jgi:hypothetical protein